jgi:acetoin utilization deacetylase AcuC-like enzyme
MTALLVEAVDRLCSGRLVMSHEGGYSAMYAPYCGLAVQEQMSGNRTGVPDPWGAYIADWWQQALQPHLAAAIDRVAALLDGIR